MRVLRHVVREMHAEANAEQERAARAWRNARTGREAWARFSRWLAREQPDADGDAPWWVADVYSGFQLWTGTKATRLVLFQKQHVMNAFLRDAGCRA
jgi:hypothetical protein